MRSWGRRALGVAIAAGVLLAAACDDSTSITALPQTGVPGSSGSLAAGASGVSGAIGPGAAAVGGTTSGIEGGSATGGAAAVGGEGAAGTIAAGSGAGGSVVAAAGSGGGLAGAAASGAGAGAAGMAAPAGPPAGCPSTGLAAGDHPFMLTSMNGQKYSYIISVPKTVDVNVRSPLLFHWHALSSDPEQARALTSVDAKAAAAKMIVVYPRSPDKSWDLGSCCTTIVNGTRRNEEVFVRELIADVQTKVCADPKRIYTNGFSNGGMMSQMLACKLSDVFAAAAPVGSTLTIDKSLCLPKRPLPMFLINGTQDPLVGFLAPAFAGGLSAVADVQFWADLNGCTGTPETFLTVGKATCKRYTQCAWGVEVSYCTVDGMGHCVPGMKKESATNCLTTSASGLPIALGMPNDDIDAVQMSIDFLLKFTLP